MGPLCNGGPWHEGLSQFTHTRAYGSYCSEGSPVTKATTRPLVAEGMAAATEASNALLGWPRVKKRFPKPRFEGAWKQQGIILELAASRDDSLHVAEDSS